MATFIATPNVTYYVAEPPFIALEAPRAFIHHAEAYTPTTEEKASQRAEMEQISTSTAYIIEKILEKLPPVFVEIAIAESNLNPTAHNPEYHKSGNCYSSRGILQIGCVNYDGDLDDLYDIDINIQVAQRVFEEQGYKAWGVCKELVKCYE